MSLFYSSKMAIRFISILLCLIASVQLQAQDQRDISTMSEHILSYHSDIKIDTTCEVYVTETIEVVAKGYNIKRGIYREIPLSYEYRGGNTHIGFELLSVKRDGREEPYHTKWKSNGIVVYIGDEDVFLPDGIYRYEIRYKVYNVLGFFEEYDELYWNINGNGWDFEIDSISAVVHVPQGAGIVQYTGYTGAYGEDGNDYEAHATDSSVTFIGTRSLSSEENLTVSVAWEKGNLSYPTAWQKFMYWIESYMIYVACALGLLLGFGFNFYNWYKYGRDPKPGTIIPLFYPPTGFSPAECAYLYNQGRPTKSMFGAQLLGLAVKGVVEIEYKKEKGMFGGSYYVIIRKELSEAKKELNKIERAFYDRLFGSKDILTVKKKKYNARIASASKLLDALLDRKQDKKYFVRNSHLKARQFIFLLITVGAGILAYISYGGAVPVIIAAGILHLIMNLIFTNLYEQPTKEGRKKMDEIAGFAMYMKYADSQRIKALNPPTMNFEHFEENLPYAMALGLAREWEGKFDPVVLREGYGTHMYYLHGVALAHLSGFSENLSSTISSASTPPSSSGSTSGGGGFSGGGGGGGGGGGW